MPKADNARPAVIAPGVEALAVRNTLLTLTLMVAVTASFVMVLEQVLATSETRETVVAAFIAAVSGAAHYMLRTRRWSNDTVAVMMVIAVLLTALLSVVSFGSVRTAVNFLFVGAVAGAGVLLGRRALVVVSLCGIMALGVLTAAEMRGMLGPVPDFDVGLRTWIAQSAALLVVAMLVTHSRQATQQALARQLQELERRRQTEAERDRHLDRFARIFRLSPSPMVAQSATTGIILDVNAAFERCYGWQRDQVLGHTDHFLWVDLLDRERHVHRLFSDRRVDAMQCLGKRSDGSTFEVLVSSVLGDNPDDTLIISTVTDISAELRHRQQLTDVARGVASATGEAFFHALTEQLGRVVQADSVVVCERQPDGSMQTLAVWRDGRQSANFRFDLPDTPCADTMLQSGLMVYPEAVTTRYPLARGLVAGHYEAYAGQALRDGDSQPVGVLFVLWRQPTTLTDDVRALLSIFVSRAEAELQRLQRDRDIERLQATLEQRVRDRTAELERLNAELDAFAYSVSHDLKAPLRSIDGFTQLLIEQAGDRLEPDDRDLLNRVVGSTQRMGSIINDLLSLARVSQGMLQRDPLDLSELARHVVSEELRKYPDREVTIDIEPGMQVSCDARLVRVAMENLIGNALKYTRKRSDAVIQIGRLPAAEGADRTRFFIRDNGAGFDMAHAGLLFKPFQRLHRPSEFEGTGIGLATVRRVVERHGGTIEGQGVRGEGAEFRFDLGPDPVQG